MRVLSRLLPVIPELPEYERGGGPVIPQAVVLRDGAAGAEVLLVKRTSPRAWELPGGYVNPDERLEEALAREVREETGLDVRLDRLQGWYIRTGFRPHRSPVYVCTPVAGEMRASHEAVDIGFFPVARLPLGLFPWYRPVIQDAARGAVYTHPQVQHLGLRAVLAAGAIHLAALAGAIR
jgi:8-oxo-dGTP diphosphatase